MTTGHCTCTRLTRTTERCLSNKKKPTGYTSGLSVFLALAASTRGLHGVARHVLVNVAGLPLAALLPVASTSHVLNPFDVCHANPTPVGFDLTPFGAVDLFDGLDGEPLAVLERTLDWVVGASTGAVVKTVLRGHDVHVA